MFLLPELNPNSNFKSYPSFIWCMPLVFPIVFYLYGGTSAKKLQKAMPTSYAKVSLELALFY